jgi:hypothetical protein
LPVLSFRCSITWTCTLAFLSFFPPPAHCFLALLSGRSFPLNLLNLTVCF